MNIGEEGWSPWLQSFCLSDILVIKQTGTRNNYCLDDIITYHDHKITMVTVSTTVAVNT